MSDLPTDSQPLPSNRLTIAHLLLWTATTALAIGAIMPEPVELRALEPDVPAAFRARLVRQERYWRIATVVTGPVLGAGLAALAIAGWRYYRGLRCFPSQPGHWILMIIGMSTLAFMTMRMTDRVVENLENGLPVQPLLDVFTVVSAGFLMLAIGLLLAAYVHVDDPLRWKRVFAIAGINFVAFFCGGCLLEPPVRFSLFVAWAVSLATVYTTPVSILVALVMDVRSGRRYDVFHWVGAAAVPVLAAVLTGVVLLLEFARP